MISDPSYLLALNSHPKVGSQTIKKILAFFDKPEDIWMLDRQKIISRISDSRLLKLILEAREIDPETERKKLEHCDVGYITIYDSQYPKLLKEISDNPIVLYIRGNHLALRERGLAVVGSRKFSQYGKKVAYQLSKQCAKNGLAIISGLALGVDAFAHQAALDAGGITIGVLGCGLDRIYPVSNFALGNEIIKKGGAIISEFPLGTPPMKQNFPARNRIIAGLSQGVLVIEAAEQSGALITAYQALEYNREVFAVPGNIDSQNSLGTNKLIKEGAKLAAGAEDILMEFKIEERKSFDKARDLLPETSDEKKICSTMNDGEKLVDEIIRISGLNVIAVASSLSILEMKGIVENLGGGRYKLTQGK